MEKERKVQLTSSEMSYLWNTFQADSLAIQVFKHFLQHIEDAEIEKLIRHGMDLSQQHLEIIEKIFKDEGIALPKGFTEEDVNLEAKRLFTDSFYLYYIKHMTKGGLQTYSRILPNMYREDVLSFYSKCLTSTIELNKEATDILLVKGLAVRPPYIPGSQEVEIVKKQGFMLEGLGNGRPLTGVEISNLFTNIQTNHIGTAISTAFSQVIRSPKIQKVILRGKDIALKHIDVFSNYLKNNSLPVPMSYDQNVTDSTEAPFSDRLMFFHYGMMMYSGVGNYGTAISESQKSDLVIDYSRILVEILKFAEDIMNVMIEEGWLEKPPSAIERMK